MTEHPPALLRQIYSARDFQLALSSLAFFLEVEESGSYSKVDLRRFRCYVDAATVAYCRPFTRSRGLPILKFEQIGLILTEAEMNLHDRILAYRHQVVAHSDPALMRIRLKAFPLDFGDGRVFMMPQLVTDEGLWFLEDRRAWQDLLHKLIHGISVRLWDLAQSNPEGLDVLQDYMAPEPMAAVDFAGRRPATEIGDDGVSTPPASGLDARDK